MKTQPSFAFRSLLVAASVFVAGLATAGEAVSELPSVSTNAEPHSATNRFLFIVETSKSMESRSANTLKAVQDLLGTGMHGQLHAGDSIGIWTYDKDVHTGRFPVQQWSTNMQRTVTLRAMSFLNQHTYENAGKLARAMAVLESVSRGSEFLTVVLINDGAEPVIGTPFDKAINDSFNLWRKQQDDAKMPFITVLRAQGGRMTHYSVNPVPWPVEMPPLPAEYLAAKSAAPPAPAQTPKPAPVYAAPIIIRGTKPSTPPAVQPADSATSGSPAGATNQAPPAVTAPATNTSSATLGAVEITEQAGKPPSNPVSVTNEPTAGVATVLTTAPEAKKAADAARSATPVPLVAIPPTTQAELPVASPPPARESNTIALAAQPPRSDPPASAAPAAVVPDNSSTPAVALTEPASGTLLVKLGVGGLAVAAISSALLLLRRARSVPRPSLITQSMDRHKS